MGNKCDELRIPKHLHKGNKERDPHFGKAEKLYRRIPPDGFLRDREISAQYLRISDLSVNREKYSKVPTEDVLFDIKAGKHFLSYGVIEFQVGFVEALSFRHPDDKNDIYSFKIKHEPEECMYPHSVLMVLLNKKECNKLQPKSLRSLFRDELMKNYHLAKQPDES